MSNTDLEQGSVTEFAAHLINKIEWGTTPEPVSWMPATTAWYLLFALILITIVAYFIARYFKWLKASYLRQADQLLEQYRVDSHQCIAHLAKRVANQRWPEHSVGLMDATAFTLFLNQQQGKLGLSSACCDEIFAATYQPLATVSEQHIIEVKRWIGAINV